CCGLGALVSVALGCGSNASTEPSIASVTQPLGPPAPGQVTLIAPSGSGQTPTPTYKWTADGVADSYRLWVDDASQPGKVVQLYSKRQAGCPAGALWGAMNGAQEVPTNASTATGSCSATLNIATGAVTFNGSFSGLGTNATAAHIHGLAPVGMSAGVLIG